MFGLALPGVGSGSQLIDRNATDVTLAVNADGEALVSYRKNGVRQRVLAWGAVDARHPSPNARQVTLKLDYSGGSRTFGRRASRSFENACRRYDGPRLPFLVPGAACKASDGSYWALQRWQPALPNLGFLPWLPRHRAVELHISHWTRPVAKLDVWTRWVSGGRYHHLFGRLTYRGTPVYGYRSTKFGAPTDGYGRLVYLDTFNARSYGRGWRRENSFVSHNPTGAFCYGLYARTPGASGYEKPVAWPAGRPRGPGVGDKYRLSVSGPGVTPDVSVVVPGLHDFNPRNPADVAYAQAQEAALNAIRGRHKLCVHR
ncbi:MAG: hypothetical protein M3292_00500 [Actinomycetota bacterium]|nr:hypothetical protein [Actinomycetota bacterium]